MHSHGVKLNVCEAAWGGRSGIHLVTQRIATSLGEHEQKSVKVNVKTVNVLGQMVGTFGALSLEALHHVIFCLPSFLHSPCMPLPFFSKGNKYLKSTSATPSRVYINTAPYG